MITAKPDKLNKVKHSMVENAILSLKGKFISRMRSMGATDQEMYDLMKEIAPKIQERLLEEFMFGHEHGEPLI